MKEILIITNYYPPETGAASNRIFHLAEGIKKSGFKVSVLTPLPNYPKGSWNKIPKTVIIQSPPLLVAFTAVFFLCSKKRKLILNVSDLWPLAGLELGAFKKNWSYKLLETIERFNYKHAHLVLGQSEEILTHVKALFPDKETFLYRNYPDFNAPEPTHDIKTSEKLKMVYAGLLGIAQGIYTLCEALDYTNVQFHIYGAGAEQQAIETLIENKPELDIVYHGEVSRKALHKVLTSYDFTIIPLLNRIYGSVRSNSKNSVF